MELKKYILPMPAANDVAHTDEQSDAPSAAEAAPQPDVSTPDLLPIETVREHFPRIADRIELLWGSWELQQYFTTLLISERGDREGFPIKVVSALIKIHAEHSQIAPTEDPANKYKKNDKLWLAQ